jgi:hypothetical protein
VLKGDVELRQGGQAVTDPDAVRAMIAAELDGSLARLAQSALLVA